MANALLLPLPTTRQTRQPVRHAEIDPTYGSPLLVFAGDVASNNLVKQYSPMSHMSGMNCAYKDYYGATRYGVDFGSIPTEVVSANAPMTAVAYVQTYQIGSSQYPGIISVTEPGGFNGVINLTAENNSGRRQLQYRIGSDSVGILSSDGVPDYNLISSSYMRIVATWDGHSVRKLYVAYLNSNGTEFARSVFGKNGIATKTGSATFDMNVGTYYRSGIWRSYPRGIFLAALMQGVCAPPDAAHALLDNPWQIFQPPVRRLYLNLGGGQPVTPNIPLLSAPSFLNRTPEVTLTF